jgi:hypothetical protein
MSARRGDLDDPAPAALAHPGNKGLREPDRGDRVLLVAVHPFVARRIQPAVRGFDRGAARAVDQDVDAVERRFRRGDDVPEFGVEGQVAERGGRAASVRRDLGRHRLRTLYAAPVHDDAHALAAQHPRDLGADPRRASRHQCPPPGQP